MHRGSLVPIAFSLCLVFSREINFMPAKDTHYTRGRCFNTERANLFSDIKQPAQFSSYLASRNSLLIIPSQLKQFLHAISIHRRGGINAEPHLILSREINFTPTKDTHHTRGRCFNTERANLFSDIKQPAQFSSYLASRNSLLIIPFTAKAVPTSDIQTP